MQIIRPVGHSGLLRQEDSKHRSSFVTGGYLLPVEGFKFIMM